MPKVIVTRNYKPFEVDRGVYLYRKRRKRARAIKQGTEECLNAIVDIWGVDNVQKALETKIPRYDRTITQLLANGGHRGVKRFLRDKYGYKFEKEGK